jgi:transcriptional regulator with XRE-family HTH domain
MTYISGPGDPDKIALAIKAFPGTYRDLAAKAEVSDASIGAYAARARKPSPAVLVRLAKSLGINVLDLMTDGSQAA